MQASNFTRPSDALDFIYRVASEPPTRSRGQLDACISGFLYGMDDNARTKLLEDLMDKFETEGSGHEVKSIRVLKAAPFRRSTWEHLGRFNPESRSLYWKEV